MILPDFHSVSVPETSQSDDIVVAYMVADMAANMAADMEVDEVANKKEEKKGHAKKRRRKGTQFGERVGHGGWLIGPKPFRPEAYPTLHVF